MVPIAHTHTHDSAHAGANTDRLQLLARSLLALSLFASFWSSVRWSVACLPGERVSITELSDLVSFTHLSRTDRVSRISSICSPATRTLHSIRLRRTRLSSLDHSESEQLKNGGIHTLDWPTNKSVSVYWFVRCATRSTKLNESDWPSGSPLPILV